MERLVFVNQQVAVVRPVLYKRQCDRRRIYEWVQQVCQCNARWCINMCMYYCDLHFEEFGTVDVFQKWEQRVLEQVYYLTLSKLTEYRIGRECMRSPPPPRDAQRYIQVYSDACRYAWKCILQIWLIDGLHCKDVKRLIAKMCWNDRISWLE